MRVLLIEPNSEFAIKSALGISGPPLGLAYLAAYLREYSTHTVKILDALTLDCTTEDVADEIRAFKPDLVGMNVMSTPSVYSLYDYSKIVKEVNPDIFIVAGGQHVTFAPEQTLKECKHLDAVVRGEGEETLLELAEILSKKKVLKGCKGLTFRKNGGFVSAPERPLIGDLDTVPFPAYNLLPMDKYALAGRNFAAIITSRGCPFGCTFCASSRLVGKNYRERSAKNVVSEIKMLKRDYGITNIEFIDDLFTLNPKRVKEIGQLLKKEGLKISWTCSSRADIIVRNPEIPGYLKSAGCHTVYVGAESGTQKGLDLIKKGTTIDQVRGAVKKLKAAKLSVLASFVIGVPGETKEDVEKTIKFAKELDPDFAQFSICTPFPGTPLYDQMKKEGRIIAKEWSDFTILKPVANIPNMTYNELRGFLKKAYISFYARPTFIWRNIKARNWQVLRKLFSSTFNYALGRESL
jgi:radical SAM superfamily enzyme YgiQ (UPF0313 family)